MAQKKKIMICFIAIIVIACILVIWVTKKEKNTQPPISLGQQTFEIEGEMEDQLKIILNHQSQWKNNTGAEYYAYAITDLDHNGRLEIIAASSGGTGKYTNYNIYEVKEDKSGIEQCTTNLLEGDSGADIIVNDWITYYDVNTNTYHYVVKDAIRVNATQYLENKRDIVFKNSNWTENNIAVKESVYAEDKADFENQYQNKSGEEIDALTYDAMEDALFASLDFNLSIVYFTSLLEK